MALEGGDDDFGPFVIIAARLDVIAIGGEHALHGRDRAALCTACERRIIFDRMRAHIEADSGFRERTPRKIFAGIDLTARRNIRMSENALRRDLMPARDV